LEKGSTDVKNQSFRCSNDSGSIDSSSEGSCGSARTTLALPATAQQHQTQAQHAAASNMTPQAGLVAHVLLANIQTKQQGFNTRNRNHTTQREHPPHSRLRQTATRNDQCKQAAGRSSAAAAKHNKQQPKAAATGALKHQQLGLSTPGTTTVGFYDAAAAAAVAIPEQAARLLLARDVNDARKAAAAATAQVTQPTVNSAEVCGSAAAVAASTAVSCYDAAAEAAAAAALRLVLEPGFGADCVGKGDADDVRKAGAAATVHVKQPADSTAGVYGSAAAAAAAGASVAVTAAAAGSGLAKPLLTATAVAPKKRWLQMCKYQA
jgi:hypothetical protein